MKPFFYKFFFSFFLFLSFTSFSFISAQDIINLKITSPGDVDWDIDALKTANDHGPQITTNLSGEIVQAFDGVTAPTDNDTWTEFGYYGCDSIVNPSEVAGKIAMISRGACSFSDKIWNAEKAGAIGVIVANRAPIGLVTGTHNPGLIIMAGTPPASDSITIPAIFISYEDRLELESRMNAGAVMGTFEAAPLYDPTGPLAYSTPLDQVRPLDMQVVAYTRTSDTLLNVTFNIEIEEPNGTTMSFTQVEDTLLPGKDWVVGTIHDPLIQFTDASYTPSEVGTYVMTYSAATQEGTFPLDNIVLTKTFEVTDDYTFALDNGNVMDIDGMQLSATSYSETGLGVHNVGSIFQAGPNGGTATHASFAVANVGALDIGNGFDFTVKLYNADVDGDSIPDTSLSTALDSITYSLNGTEVPNELITVTFPTPITLDPDGMYCLMIETQGFLTSDVMPAYTMAGGEIYPRQTSVYQFGTEYQSSGYEYWNSTSNDYPHGGRNPMVRLHIQGFIPPVGVELLPADQVSVFPTLTNNQVNVKFDLNQASSEVYLIVTALNGHTMSAKKYNNISNETVELDVKSYASGNYFLTIKTDKGVRTERFVVIH